MSHKKCHSVGKNELIFNNIDGCNFKCRKGQKATLQEKQKTKIVSEKVT